MPFEVFTDEAAAVAGKPCVSIQKKGIISLNRAAYALLKEPAAVELLYDRERSLVGLRAAAPKMEHARAVRNTSNHTAYVVTATRFTNHYGIPTEVGHRWAAQLDGNVLFIDISQPPEV